MSALLDKGFAPGRLWSLLAIMERFSLTDFWAIANEFQNFRDVLYMVEGADSGEAGDPLSAEEIEGFKRHLKKLAHFCDRLALTTSWNLIESVQHDDGCL